MTDSLRPRLRSQEWLAGDVKNAFIARHHLRALGLTTEQLDGRPVIGICTTWSELTPCNSHLRRLADSVRSGILQAGGLPLEFPVFSVSEPLVRPSSMLYRNLMAMEVEEALRAHPLDAVVLLTGCDKTTPAALMGAASVDIPAIILTGGPMLNGRFRGRPVGSGTDIWRMTEAVRAGVAPLSDLEELEGCLNRSEGHCMTMGTASTMACLAEVLGMQLPGAAALPAVDARRYALAERTGSQAVRLALEPIRPSEIMSEEAFHNSLIANAALGGSTNAVLHLLAIAGRLGVDLSLDDFDSVGSRAPLLVDLMPTGRFLMEEFSYAGGVPALVNRIESLLDRDTITVTGSSLITNCVGQDVHDDEVIRPLDKPVHPPGAAVAVLRGTLAPNGAIIKASAADPQFLTHSGPALVFDSLEEYLAVIDDPDLDVTPDTVLIVRNVGPRGYPGMPEVGNLPLPRRLLEAGVSDMLRITDARMSGTAFGACVLHVAPEAAIGGPLGLVVSGDIVSINVPERRLDLEISPKELSSRYERWVPPPEAAVRGWTKLYIDHVMQADTGVDLDFLVGASGNYVPKKAF